MREQELDYYFFSRKHTDSLRGMAILVVILTHFAEGQGVGGLQFIAAAAVGVFLVCSGYGLAMSYLSKGMKYYWIRRFLKILIPCWLFQLAIYVFSQDFQVSGVLKNVILSESNWFVGYLLICYFLFGICYSFFDKKNCRSCIRVLIMTGFFLLWFLWECFCPRFENIPFLQARQMLCFPLGLLVAESQIVLQKLKAYDCMNSWKKMGILLILLVTGCSMQLLTQRIDGPLLCVNTVYLIANILLTSAFIIGSRLFILFFDRIVIQKIGLLSYELMLVHYFYVFSVNGILEVGLFVIKTIVFSIALYLIDSFLIKSIDNVLYRK